MSISIALVGDYNEEVIAHTAIPRVLELASIAVEADVTWSWIETTAIRTLSPAGSTAPINQKIY